LACWGKKMPLGMSSSSAAAAAVVALVPFWGVLLRFDDGAEELGIFMGAMVAGMGLIFSGKRRMWLCQDNENGR
jgi:hypothetical protein